MERRVREVLDFWFALPTEQHFAKDAALDHAIAERFGELVDDLVATDGTGCWSDPETLLGATVAIDQFARNIHRDTPLAFAGDGLAQRLALHAIGLHWDRGYPPDRRAFAYMPLMHAEDRALQALSVAKFEALGDENHLRYAREHRDVIARFGRFPSRNAALGRTSTAEEEVYLSRPDADW